MATLQLTGVTRSFDGREVLAGVDLLATTGETLAILGPSGSGKSTLLNIIGGLDRADSGKVALGDLQVHAITGRELAAYRARQVGFVFQDHLLLPQLTAIENVELATLSPAARGVSGRPPMELLGELGVAERANAFPSQLSGGERQRVAIARALVNRPQLLLCDEPTGSLDSETGAAVVSLLLEAARSAGACLVTVTHNEAHAARFQRVLRMADGRLAEAPDRGQPA